MVTSAFSPEHMFSFHSESGLAGHWFAVSHECFSCRLCNTVSTQEMTKGHVLHVYPVGCTSADQKVFGFLVSSAPSCLTVFLFNSLKLNGYQYNQK